MQQQWIFFKDSFLKNHNSLTCVLVFLFLFLQNNLFLIANVRNTKHESLKVYTCSIAYLVHYGFLYLRSGQWHALPLCTFSESPSSIPYFDGMFAGTGQTYYFLKKDGFSLFQNVLKFGLWRTHEKK
jgi:hypothetical protein